MDNVRPTDICSQTRSTLWSFEKLNSAGHTSYVESTEWAVEELQAWAEVTMSDRILHHHGEGTIHYHDGENSNLYIEFTVDYSGVTITKMELESPDVTVGMLRTISLSTVRQDILDGLQKQQPIRQPDKRITDSRPYRDWLSEWPNGDGIKGLLAVVAHVYNGAIKRESPPTKAVVDTFGVSRSTASRMIARARKDGIKLSDPAPYPGKRKRDQHGTTGNEHRGSRDDQQ